MESEERPEASGPPPGRKDSVPRGVGLLLLGHLAAFGLASVVGLASPGLGVLLLVTIGVAQLLWLAPLWLWQKGAPETRKGLAIGAAVTLFLNAGCWGLVMTTFSLHG